jgi:hypothetical protein
MPNAGVSFTSPDFKLRDWEEFPGCDYDGAGACLQHIYGKLEPRYNDTKALFKYVCIFLSPVLPPPSGSGSLCMGLHDESRVVSKRACCSMHLPAA